MITKREFYIDGKWVAPAGGEGLPGDRPLDRRGLRGDLAGVRGGYRPGGRGGEGGFPAWAATPPAERRRLVEGILEQYNLRKEEMAQAISIEMGAPIDMSRNDQAECLPWHLKNFLKAFDHMEWVRPLGSACPGYDDRAGADRGRRLITPWNWPMNQVTLKVIPALLAGCTCVLKPSEESPLSSMLFAEFCHDAGIPPGVFNLVNGDGAGVGSRLSSHPDVEMISFTGSTRAGRAISKAAAETLKRVTLELGGKGANLVFADADARAVERGVRHMMNNSGQSCNAPSRMLVERPSTTGRWRSRPRWRTGSRSAPPASRASISGRW
jgi:aldehyde dehydrogenase (NAD+)